MKKYSCANGLSRRKFAFLRLPFFPAKVDDFQLKSSILDKICHSRISGSNVSLPVFTHAVSETTSSDNPYLETELIRNGFGKELLPTSWYLFDVGT